MNKLITILLLIFSANLSHASCRADDRTFMERMFRGNGGTIFTCRIITMSIPQYIIDDPNFIGSDGNILGTATAEITEIFSGHADTNIILLHTESILQIGSSYLIYSSGGGKVFRYGNYCDRWSKQVSNDPSITKEIISLRLFKEIFKNKLSGHFTFPNSENKIYGEGYFKKGVCKEWKHYYHDGILKEEYDSRNKITTKYSSSGLISSKNTAVKNISYLEQYSNNKSGQLTYSCRDQKQGGTCSGVF